MLKPLGDRVVLKVEEKEQKVGGFVIAGAGQDATKTAKVVAAGDGIRTLNGELVAPSVKAGDTVLVESHAGIEVKDERKKLYNFTSPYYTDASGFLVNKSANIKSIEDLNGKTIGVAQGSITQRLITELGKKKGLTFKFVELGSYPELITSLHAHRIDAFSVDRSILSGYISKRTELLDDSFKPSDYGIVTKKSNTELNDYLDTLVTKWSKDGSLQKLYDRYKLKPSSHTAD